MTITGIIIATAIVGGVGVLIGVLLGIAANVFKVEVDEKEILISELLPGNNCGGCGYAGCNQLAKAIAGGEAGASACPVGGASTAAAIAEIVGGDTDMVKMIAVVKCRGTLDQAKEKYEYFGNISCIEANYVPGGGSKSCTYGCLGYGSCVNVCDFDAISIVDGVALVNKNKCVACGKCVNTCPKNIIELVPYDACQVVLCMSQSKGKDVKAVCKTGCIACKLCEKACEFDAIKVENNLATIDYSKCTRCGKCAEKCPSKIISI